MLTLNIGNLFAVVVLMGGQCNPHLRWLGALGGLFLLTMRDGNGFATVWDLIT